MPHSERPAHEVADCQVKQSHWQFSLATLLLLLTGAAVAMSAFVAIRGVGRFLTVVWYSSFVGYLLGRSFQQNHLYSGILGWWCAFFAGMLYGLYIYPVLENDYHDLSSICGVVAMSNLSASVFSVLIAVAGRALRR